MLNTKFADFMLTSGTQMIIDHHMVIYLDQIRSAISNIQAFHAFSSTAVINRKETGPWLVAAQLMQCCRMLLVHVMVGRLGDGAGVV